MDQVGPELVLLLILAVTSLALHGKQRSFQLICNLLSEDIMRSETLFLLAQANTNRSACIIRGPFHVILN